MKHRLLGVHVVCKFFFECSLDVKQTKQMAVDVKHSSHVEHRTVDVILVFAFKHGEGIHCRDVTTHVLTRDIKDV